MIPCTPTNIFLKAKPIEVRLDRTARFRPFKRNRTPSRKSPEQNKDASPEIPNREPESNGSPDLLGKFLYVSPNQFFSSHKIDNILN